MFVDILGFMFCVLWEARVTCFFFMFLTFKTIPKKRVKSALQSLWLSCDLLILMSCLWLGSGAALLSDLAPSGHVRTGALNEPRV